MENIAIPLAGALMGYLLFKLMLKPLRWGLRLALNSGAGLLSLTLLSIVPGLAVPVNAVTVLAAGTLGLPGLGLLVLLERIA